jgi:hypothetical protein
MMGRQWRDQGRLFYEFRLEDRIPSPFAADERVRDGGARRAAQGAEALL